MGFSPFMLVGRQSGMNLDSTLLTTVQCGIDRT